MFASFGIHMQYQICQFRTNIPDLKQYKACHHLTDFEAI